MSRKLKNSAMITIQVVVESPDEVIMLAEAPIVEFPRRKAHQVVRLARKMQEVIECDYTDFVNYANDKINVWLEEENIDDRV